MGTLSSGNLPQLTLETILKSLFDSDKKSAEKNDEKKKPKIETAHIGTYYDHYTMEPFVTNTPDTTKINAHNTLFPSFQTSIELYINHELKIILTIQKGKILEKKTKEFLSHFFNFVENDLSPRRIILLTSLGPSHRPAENKDLIQWFYITRNQIKDGQPTVKNDNYVREIDDKNSNLNSNLNLHQKIVNILAHKLNLPPTHLSPDEIEAHLHYIRIQYGEKGKDPYYFPYPIKGGGMAHQIAKQIRKKSKFDLIGLVSFGGPKSILNLSKKIFDIIFELDQCGLHYEKNYEKHLEKNVEFTVEEDALEMPENDIIDGSSETILPSDWQAPDIEDVEFDQHC
jgi:hypothetical protein